MTAALAVWGAGLGFVVAGALIVLLGTPGVATTVGGALAISGAILVGTARFVMWRESRS